MWASLMPVAEVNCEHKTRRRILKKTFLLDTIAKTYEPHFHPQRKSGPNSGKVKDKQDICPDYIWNQTQIGRGPGRLTRWVSRKRPTYKMPNVCFASLHFALLQVGSRKLGVILLLRSSLVHVTQKSNQLLLQLLSVKHYWIILLCYPT